MMTEDDENLEGFRPTCETDVAFWGITGLALTFKLGPDGNDEVQRWDQVFTGETGYRKLGPLEVADAWKISHQNCLKIYAYENLGLPLTELQLTNDALNPQDPDVWKIDLEVAGWFALKGKREPKKRAIVQLAVFSGDAEHDRSGATKVAQKAKSAGWVVIPKNLAYFPGEQFAFLAYKRAPKLR